jgi:hypothetical protein
MGMSRWVDTTSSYSDILDGTGATLARYKTRTAKKRVIDLEWWPAYLDT